MIFQKVQLEKFMKKTEFVLGIISISALLRLTNSLLGLLLDKDLIWFRIYRKLEGKLLNYSIEVAGIHWHFWQRINNCCQFPKELQRKLEQ